MKKCKYCKIEVGSDVKKCPFCQSKLAGEDEERYFPRPTSLKITSFFYKLQMFIVCAIIVGSLGVEFILNIHPIKGMYASVILAVWLLAFEFVIIKLFKNRNNPSRIVTLFALVFSLLLFASSYYIGHYKIIGYVVIPIIVMGTLIGNFVLSMSDKQSNGLVYLLFNVLAGTVPYVIIYTAGKKISFWWAISLLLSVILFIGTVIFKGRKVFSEIQKRLNM